MNEYENDNMRTGHDGERERPWQQDSGGEMARTDQAIRAFVSERPFVAVGLALIAGYVIARSINVIH